MHSAWIKRVSRILIVSLLIGCLGIGVAETDSADAEALYTQGLSLLLSESSSDEDIRSGLQSMANAALLGYSDASYVLGLLFETGLYVEQDYEAAFTFYARCVADSGYTNIQALWKVASFTERGLGTEQDLDMAAELFRIGADFGHADSILSLALLDLSGERTPETEAEAKALLEQASLLGNTEAMRYNGFCYEYGIGTEPDYALAGEWLKKAEAPTEETLYYGEGSGAVVRMVREDMDGAGDLSEAFCTNLYEAVWVRMRYPDSDLSAGRHIAIAVSSLYPQLDPDRLSKAVLNCMNWIAAHEPELQQAYETVTSNHGDYPRSVFAQVYYQEGFQAFDNGDLQLAAASYIRCIEMDAKDVQARFELAEVYIGMGQLEKAKTELNDLTPYVRDDIDRAHYYRRIGFIAIDEMDYELGAACMLYSLKFDETEGARQELEYIRYITGTYPDYGDAQVLQILTDRGIRIWEPGN